MNLAPMRFKEYSWPHNPEIYTAAYQRRVAVHPLAQGRPVLQELGESVRVLRGEGVFVGRNAYREFQKLEAVFLEPGAGMLVHPIWQPIRAYFVSLELLEKPLPDYVHYTVEFWEDGSRSDGLRPVSVKPPASGGSGGNPVPAKAVYLVKKGDTLWGIARRFRVPLSDLIRANPQIKNPNLIYPGNRVIIP